MPRHSSASSNRPKSPVQNPSSVTNGLFFTRNQVSYTRTPSGSPAVTVKWWFHPATWQWLPTVASHSTVRLGVRTHSLSHRDVVFTWPPHYAPRLVDTYTLYLELGWIQLYLAVSGPAPPSYNDPWTRPSRPQRSGYRGLPTLSSLCRVWKR